MRGKKSAVMLASAPLNQTRFDDGLERFKDEYPALTLIAGLVAAATGI
jgi:hypothetical protein